MAKVTYDQLMQNYVNASYDTLLGVANNTLDDLMPYFSKYSDDGNGATLLLPFICTALAVDGKFTQLEYRFVKEVTGIDISYDEFKNFIQPFYSDDWMERADKLADACPDEIKTSLLSFCLAFLAVDENISKEENVFISKLLK